MGGKLAKAELTGHVPRKRFGQNFLLDRMVIERIVDQISPNLGEELVEIGPGHGALTWPMLERSHHLTVVELDRNLADYLTKHPATSDMLTIYQQDAMTFDFVALANRLGNPLRLFGNLPYNISTPLLMALFGQIGVIRDMHFMFQAEVVERLAATPNSKSYGRLSVITQYFCQVTNLFSVPPVAFYPAPKVKSSLVALYPHTAPPHPVKSLTALQKVCAAAFNQRRKTLRNSLSAFFSPEQLEKLGINPMLRAENLTVADYAILANQIAS